jgi:hypothetical protein
MTKITKIIILLCAVLLFNGCKKKDKEENSTSTIIPNNFLSSEKYDRLVIQIQAVSGYDLTTQTTDNLVSFLNSRLNKPAGIEIVKSNVASPGKAVLTLSELKELEKKNRTKYPDGKTLTAYFFVVDGEYSESTANTKVLGIAYSPTAMVVFGKSIQDFTGDLNQPTATTMETTVIEHEFCHILGLVNNGTGLQSSHEDDANKKHCNNSSCLMYHNIETSESMTDIFGNGIPALDNNCINDLKANGGK